jgi:hypothetical protein
LTSYEICPRKGFWAQHWQRRRLDPTQMLRQAIQAGVTEAVREDFGEVAGETIMDLARDPGMELPSSHYLHQSVIHHAALADVLTTALRRPQTPAWGFPPSMVVGSLQWASSAFLEPSGAKLRQLVMPSVWNDERHWSEVRSWYALGEAAVYRLPVTLVVLILGQHRQGKRSGPWTKGFLHSQNHKLRFRKRSRTDPSGRKWERKFEVFSDRWEQVWREDRDEISTATWLQAMLEDDILRDVCFTVEVPAPEKVLRERILEMAERKLERLAKITKLPEASMSVCDRPPCQFKGCCWSVQEYEPSEKTGFVEL